MSVLKISVLLVLLGGGWWAAPAAQTVVVHPYDQDLNTTDSPTFDELTTTGLRQALGAPANLTAGTTGAGGDWPDGTYYLVVVAIDGAGNVSGYSNEISVVISGGTTIPLTWDQDAAWAYRLLVGTSTGVYTKKTIEIAGEMTIGLANAAWSALITGSIPSPGTAHNILLPHDALGFGGDPATQDSGIAGFMRGGLFSIRGSITDFGATSEGGGAISLFGSAGTTKQPEPLATGDGLGRVVWSGMNAAREFSAGGDIRVITADDPTDSVIPVYFSFRFNGVDLNSVEAGFADAGNFGVEGNTPEFFLGGETQYVTLQATGAHELTLFGSDDQMTPADFVVSGVIKSLGGYKSSDGTAGATVTTCTGFKDGLCVSGT